MVTKALILLLLALLVCPVLIAGEIGYIESFSLADDRAVPLQQLIPGSEDYYYYHCLQFQNQGQLKKSRDLLDQWIKRYSYNARSNELLNRQVLLEYPQAPEASLKFLRDKLGLTFSHSRLDAIRKATYPSKLNESILDRMTLKSQALSDYSNLSGFEDAALDELVSNKLSGDLLRDLLQRLTRPDYPELVSLVVQELKSENSGGFGAFPIHRLLLPEQLARCLELKPDLLQDTQFVQAWLVKLQPGPESDWRNDPVEKAAYLDRLWSFVQRLSPAHNPLKVHVLYQRLVLDRSQGRYDRKQFLEYLKLPRQTGYINQTYFNKEHRSDYAASLQESYDSATLCPPVGSDEPLVRSYLEQFLVQAANPEEFSTYIDKDYLKEVFATTKLLAAVGNAESWFALLTPEKVQALKERIDLEFLPTNKPLYRAGDKIVLDVAIKNVPTLIVKVYRLNTFNFYRDHNEEITTSIDLDGLVANEERTTGYKEPEIRRHVEHFEFPQLSEPGMYVVELIGNGRSSRALIRRGRLTYSERLGSAGQVFTVFDEQGNPVKDATIWLAAREYPADERGEIQIPFSTTPGMTPVILRRGDFAVLSQINHQNEQYRLTGGIHIDRESLLEGQNAPVLIRPELSLNGQPIDIKLLEEPVFQIETVDREGIRASREVRTLSWQNASETAYLFRVPEKLVQITCTLRGKIQSISQNKKQDLAFSRTVELNGIERTDRIDDLHFRKTDKSYVLELLGKSGEPRADIPLQVEFKHRLFTRTVNTTLQTDDQGRVYLGWLAEITWVKATAPKGGSRTWNLLSDQFSYPDVFHVAAGSAFSLPISDQGTEEREKVFSLLERRGNSYVKDCREFGTPANGLLEVRDLPPGDYDLQLKDTRKIVTIRVSGGKAYGKWLRSPVRCLETRTVAPLALSRPVIDGKKETVTIKVLNAGPQTRVHLVASRYLPDFPLFDGVGVPQRPGLREIRLNPPLSNFLSGRNIGEEYRYILERKYFPVRPGNLLQNPSLLLTPWNLRKTETVRRDAAAGEGWSNAPVGAPAMEAACEPACPEPECKKVAGPGGDSSCLDYLPEPALVKANLKPDAQGNVTIDLKEVGARRHLHFLAIDSVNASYRQMALSEVPESTRDVTLRQAFPPDRHFSEQKNITLASAGQALTIEDITTAKLEVYDSLASVYSLFNTLSSNATLAEFGFVLQWPTFSPERKKELYSKYACHELSFFLYRKDPDFFAKVIKPFLQNKRDRTFIDNWLLEADLAAYLEPWKYGRLNIVEKILLARRISQEAEATRRHVKDRLDLIPPDLERWNNLFKTALKGSALETEDRLGFNEAQKRVMPSQAFAPPPPPSPSCIPESSIAGGMEMAKPRGGMSKMAGPAKAGKKAKLASREMMAKDEAAPSDAFSDSDDAGGAYDKEEETDRKSDNARRQSQRQLYQALDKTEEWVENNYYRLPIEQQVANLVTVNAFWSDFAAAPANKPFLSVNAAEATHSFTEMMFALAVLDLPFTPETHATEYQQSRFKFTPKGNVLVFHKEIKPAQAPGKTQEILVGQNFFAADDRYRFENAERFDKFVTEEFETHRVYGCQVVITNPTSTRKKVEVLLQIPQGAIPVSNGFYTRSVNIQLEPFSTQTQEYAFYFPRPGTFTHYPIHVSQNEKLLAFNDPFVFNVVNLPTKTDKTSWNYVSQHGSDEQVLNFLRENNIDRLDLALIAFRMKDAGFFKSTMEVLNNRHVYQDVLWSYSIYHNNVPGMREYLKYSSLANSCGLYLESPLLTLNPVERFSYQHREYWPLVNARVNQLGRNRAILNAQLLEQYQLLMRYLSYKPVPTEHDCLSLTYYMLLQDRIDEAEGFFRRAVDQTHTSTIQYQYLKAWLAFCREKPEDAKAIAVVYKDYPVDRWRFRFQEVLAQADEISGKTAGATDKEDRSQQMAALAATEPNLDFKVEDRKIALSWQNLKDCRIRYYLMDLELMFSRNPFVQEVSNQFSVIQPNQTVDLKLENSSGTQTLELPQTLRDKNVMIEISSGGVTRSQAYYPHSLAVRIMENYGQLRVGHQPDEAPLAKVYVKVYAKTKDGQVQFFKDGYTDLRGRFDYTSLSTDDLDRVDRFSLLIMSEQFGAVVREAAPPKR